jgi:hypothetical protein
MLGIFVIYYAIVLLRNQFGGICSWYKSLPQHGIECALTFQFIIAAFSILVLCF